VIAIAAAQVPSVIHPPSPAEVIHPPTPTPAVSVPKAPTVVDLA